MNVPMNSLIKSVKGVFSPSKSSGRTSLNKTTASTATDGEAVEVVRRVLLGHGDVQHHEAEHAGVEDLAEARSHEGEAFSRSQVEGVPEEHGVAQRCHDPCQDLHTAIGADSAEVQPRASHGLRQPQRQGHGGVEVGARDVAQRVDGHHQNAGNRYTTPNCIAGEHIATDGEDEQEGADELSGATWLHAMVDSTAILQDLVSLPLQQS
eukprot:CAMPEP_0115551632 /NCGR_PEP_ID=MMETSP0271-20121206/95829_1 /TAXON_ID=71861 /ORGANISM="Scrippsiella trochoidea, Strain CCMP3099" /LENGTH=207 /DNA_ID=CAMNT_0002985235 /DNA_START=11 /DNA_END=633 /DNA_ORIENTATION=-